jgi:hypothetical protein
MSPQSQTLDKPRKPHAKIEMHIAPTKPGGFLFQMITHIIEKIIVIHSS